MELRQPPRTSSPAPADRTQLWLMVASVVLIVALGALVLWRDAAPASGPAARGGAERTREVASKLKAAGAVDEAARLYEDYLARTDAPAETRARIAYSLGTTYLSEGRPEKALRWFYEAETIGAGPLEEELGQKIVHTLERLGRHHAAQSALASRVRLEPDAEGTPRSTDDPVVARIGGHEIVKSEVERALDDLPAEMAREMAGKPEQLLKRFVAEELIWRKARKLEYDRDPEVLRQVEAMARRLAVARFIEREIAGGITVNEADLANFFEANRDTYKKEGEETVSLESVRPRVEADYRLMKMQSAYDGIIESELSTADVQLFPERMTGDG